VDLDGPWRPTGWQPPLLNIGVVEIREVAATGAPMRWVLLTPLPCQTLAEEQRVAGRYTARWLVEEYHKALKSGTEVEASQLSTRERLEALIGVLAVVAVRLLNTKLLARSRPESAAPMGLFDPQILALLEKKIGAPPEGWSHRSLLRALARVGGFIGRKRDGEPGWQTIWRGWQRLLWMAEEANLIQLQKRCG
jgi:Transposase Tn5 dimerisation domain